MRIFFFFDNMQATRSAKEYARGKIGPKISKYAPNFSDATFSFAKDGDQYKVTCLIRGGRGFNMHVGSEDDDLYSAIDSLGHRIDDLARRKRERRMAHKRRGDSKWGSSPEQTRRGSYN